MPKEFTVNLEDKVVTEDTDATFTCKVNDEDLEVNWLIDEKTLPVSDKYLVSSEGTSHTLTIKNVTPDDSCDVQATFNDKSTSAKLSVKGKNSEYIFTACNSFLSEDIHGQLKGKWSVY